MKINWEVYAGSGQIDVSLGDINLTQEKWDKLSEEEKEDALRCYMDEWIEKNAWDNYFFQGWE